MLLSALVLLAMAWAWLVPESWKRDCDICGTYQSSCSKFTVHKDSDVVLVVRDCGNVYHPSEAVVRMTLSKTDSESFVLRAAKEQPLPLKPGMESLLTFVSKDTKAKRDTWNVVSVGVFSPTLFEMTYERK